MDTGTPREPAATGGGAVADGAVADADARVLRRARRAGLRTFLVLAVVLVAANVAFGGEVAGAVVWVCAAFVIGTLVTAGWLVLVLALDMLAGEVPSRRRALWTLGAFALAFISPVLPAAALQAAGG